MRLRAVCGWSRNGEAFFFNDTATTEIYALSLHDALPICEDWKDEEYPVFLDRTRCNYGGERVWFLCPARGCSRRVAVVYGGSNFFCWDCYQPSYDNQPAAADSRAPPLAPAHCLKLGGAPQ